MAEPFDRFPERDYTDAYGLISGGDPPPPETPAIYRLGFSALAVPGLTEPIQVGDVTITIGRGPVKTQKVAIQQRLPPPLVFDKSLSWQDVGSGQWVTLCEIDGQQLGDVHASLARWREEAITAASVVAALLDERLFGEEILEDVLILRSADEVGVMDIRRRIRHFVPRAVFEPELQALDHVGHLDLAGDDATIGLASRWYLKAAREGPTPDGYLYLWIALEALVEDQGGTVKSVESAMDAAGFAYNPDQGAGHPTIGRLFGLRGEIVHHGVEDSEFLRGGFYVLEAIARALIRHAAGAWLEGWNPQTGEYPPPETPEERKFHEALAHLWANPIERWHRDGLPTPPEVPPPGELADYSDFD